MVLLLPFGPFFEVHIRAALLQDPLLIPVWSRPWAAYKALEISGFKVSDQFTHLSKSMFAAMIGSLINTLHRSMPSHQVQCLIICPEVTGTLGEELADHIVIPLGFAETEPGVFSLWLNNPCADINTHQPAVDIRELAVETRDTVSELSAMSRLTMTACHGLV